MNSSSIGPTWSPEIHAVGEVQAGEADACQLSSLDCRSHLWGSAPIAAVLGRGAVSDSTGGEVVDDEIAALIATAGTTLVSLMVTDTWQQARDGFVHLWRRHRPEAADRVERELDSSRTVVLMAQAQPLPPYDLG